MEMEESRLQAAIEFAVKAHACATRKGTAIPYITHPIEVMKIVCGLTDDVETIMAAVLHDTVEDTSVGQEDIKSHFGERVSNLVMAESEDKREDQPSTMTWCERKKETLEHLKNADPDAKIICLGDKLANMRDIHRDYNALQDKLWERFNTPDGGNGIQGKRNNICWYYKGIAESLKPQLGDTPEWKELLEHIRAVFPESFQEQP